MLLAFGKADSFCIVGHLGFLGILLAAAPYCGMIALRRSKPSLGSREPSTEAVPGVMMRVITIANTDRMAPRAMSRLGLSARHCSHCTDKDVKLREEKCLAQGHTAGQCLAESPVQSSSVS